MIAPERPDRRETIRYLGGAGVEMNAEMERLMDDCEKQLLACARPKYLYKILELPQDSLTEGEDIRRHLAGCSRAVVMCATLGAEVDRLIRVAQVRDMAQAVVLDAMASVAVEQVCARLDERIMAENPGWFMTFRFSPGYGDYPISLQKTFLRLLDAQRKIGLSVSDSLLLIPAKSVTAVAGLSASPVPRGRRGCAVCSLRETCQYRRNGEHCGFENTVKE